MQLTAASEVAGCVVVLVTGPPASGKSTLAQELASRLELPYLSKDEVKEKLYDVFGSGPELEPLAERAAIAILLRVADSELRVGVSLLLESNFDTDDDVHPQRARLMHTPSTASHFTRCVMRRRPPRALEGGRRVAPGVIRREEPGPWSR